ncbi:hypothetical protein Esti_002756 [Eimeria stiedai]
MGIATSHEAGRRGPLCSRQEVDERYASAGTPPSVKHSRGVEHASSRRPPVLNPAGKISLSNLASGDVATCSTTTCGSSLSGSSPEEGSWSAGGSSASSDHKITLTLCGDKAWDRSVSAQAVSSNPDQSPRGFEPDTASPPVEDAPSPHSKWNPKGPSVQSALASLRVKALRCRSQPPPGSRPRDRGSSSSSFSKTEARTLPDDREAAALRAHLLRAEEEHRRRRFTEVGAPCSAASASPLHAQRGPPPSADLQDRFEELKGSRPLVCSPQAPATAAVCVSGVPLSPPVDPGSRGSQGNPRAQLKPLPCATETACRRSLRLAPPPFNHKEGPTTSTWIADIPPDGRWEVERGVWTRQGVHHNNAHLVDERFKAFARTKLSTPPQSGSQPLGVQSRQSPAALGWGGPPSGRMGRAPPQTAAAHHVVPMTNRGVAVATTIAIAKRRQANAEERKPQHLRIAASTAQHTGFPPRQLLSEAPPDKISGGAPHLLRYSSSFERDPRTGEGSIHAASKRAASVVDTYEWAHPRFPNYSAQVRVRCMPLLMEMHASLNSSKNSKDLSSPGCRHCCEREARRLSRLDVRQRRQNAKQQLVMHKRDLCCIIRLKCRLSVPKCVSSCTKLSRSRRRARAQASHDPQAAHAGPPSQPLAFNSEMLSSLILEPTLGPRSVDLDE